MFATFSFFLRVIFGALIMILNCLQVSNFWIVNPVLALNILSAILFWIAYRTGKLVFPFLHTLLCLWRLSPSSQDCAMLSDFWIYVSGISSFLWITSPTFLAVWLKTIFNRPWMTKPVTTNYWAPIVQHTLGWIWMAGILFIINPFWLESKCKHYYTTGMATTSYVQSLGIPFSQYIDDRHICHLGLLPIRLTRLKNGPI